MNHIPVVDPKIIRVIILLLEEMDIDETEWLKLASVNNTFEFLKEPEEDIYTSSDGKPFHENKFTEVF